MKDYKWGKGFIILILFASIGGIAGFIIAIAEERLAYTGGVAAIKATLSKFTPNLFVVALVCGIIGIVGCIYFNNLLKKDNYSNEEGSLYERYEDTMGIVVVFSTVCAIINFTAFGMNLSKDLASRYLVLFIINVILSYVGEVGSISLLKKVRPELDADPTELGFKKEYFDRLDEFEKEKVGRTSYKTISAMGISYIIVFMICWGLITTFEVSPIICLPVGVLWFIQTVMYTCYASKEK